MGFLDTLLSGRSLRLTRTEIEELIEELEREGFEPIETVRTEDGVWRDVWFKAGHPDILVPETGDGLVYPDKGVPLTLSFLLNFIELTTGGTSFQR
jgi:hypothetical protein